VIYSLCTLLTSTQWLPTSRPWKPLSACHAGVISRCNASRSRKRDCEVVKNQSLTSEADLRADLERSKKYTLKTEDVLHFVSSINTSSFKRITFRDRWSRWRFGTTYKPHLQGALKTGSEMLARNVGLITNPLNLRNIPEERRSHLHRKESLK